MDALIEERLVALREELKKTDEETEVYVRDRMLYMASLSGKIAALEALKADAPKEEAPDA